MLISEMESFSSDMSFDVEIAAVVGSCLGVKLQ